MSYNFGHIPRIVWGCGDSRYGDKDAKNKVLRIIKDAEKIFVPDSIIRDYEDFYKCKVISDNAKEPLPYLWQYGFAAHAIPSKIAIKILEDFSLDFFDGFMLRDLNLCAENNKKGMHTQNIVNERFVLDFDGLVYRDGYRTDHCYD